MIKAKKDELRICLIKKGLSITELSRLLDKDISYISQVVNAKRNPSASLARDINEILNVEFDDVFTIEGGE